MAENRTIPALFQGVSQQPAAVRALEQCEALENGYLTVADGARKRPACVWSSHLDVETPEYAKCHQYFRGDGEHKIIVVSSNVTGGRIRAYDGATGSVVTIDATDTDALAYLETSNARDKIGMLTVADTTFLWNRDVTAAAKTTSISAQAEHLFVYIKEGRADMTYSISLGTPGIAAYTSGSSPSTYSSIAVATGLQAAIHTLTGDPYTVARYANLLVISLTSPGTFPFEVYDSAGSALMVAFKNRVERYSDLPRSFVEDITIEVRGQGDSGGKSAFWVKFKKAGGNDTGYWEETVAPNAGELTELDETTMPVALVRQSDGTFVLQTIDWLPRLVGSTESSAPMPSFVGQTVNSMFYSRERLGVLAGENFVMSRTRNLYNFFPKSASVIADDDPIDATAGGTKVATLRHAVPFQRTLMLFSDDTQFPVTGGETLSPRNVRADPATEFDCSALVAPVSSGQDLFFVFERSSDGATYSGVREYFVNQSSVTNDAVDVTAHVPQYIPKDVFLASVSSTEDLLLLVSKEELNTVYFYKYLWDGDKKVQSAWGRWTFRPSDLILSAHVNKTTVWFVIQRVDGLNLEKMDLESTVTTDDLSFPVLLDTLVPVELGEGMYFASIDRTIFSAPPQFWTQIPADGSEGTLAIVAGPEYANAAGATIPFTREIGGAWHINLRGDWTGGTVYMGVKYTHELTFSEQFFRDPNNNAIQQGRLQLKHMTVAFRNAATFRARVSTPGRDDAVYQYTAQQLGIIGSLIGRPVFRSGAFTFPVASKSDRATITLENDTPYPATYYSAEWEGEFTTRSRRA